MTTQTTASPTTDRDRMLDRIIGAVYEFRRKVNPPDNLIRLVIRPEVELELRCDPVICQSFGPFVSIFGVPFTVARRGVLPDDVVAVVFVGPDLDLTDQTKIVVIRRQV